MINKVRILQGDGINEDTIWDIYKSLKDNKYSAENVTLGCGGSLLQGNEKSSINRDTHKFAMKCSCIKIGNEVRDVYKNPVTDKGKVSKKGRLDLIKNKNGEFETVNISDLPENQYHEDSVMECVFENGKILKTYTFEEVRKNVDIPINVLIRPRFGDFLYSDYEINIIRNEIKMFREAGVDGIVAGVLTKDGEIDVENMKRFIDEAQNIPITFHRAFDVCKNPIKAFHQLQELKVRNILTSGQAQDCLKGKKLLKELVDLSNKNNENKTEILVGAGLNIENIEEIADFTGAVNFHFSAKRIKQSKMEYKKQDVNMGLKEFDEFKILETDEELVREMADYLQKRF